MNIKITQSTGKNWYGKRIGEIFTVLENPDSDLYKFFKDYGYLVRTCKNGIGGVSKEDCVIVEE